MNCFKSLARSSSTRNGSVCRQLICCKGTRNTFSRSIKAKQPLQELSSISQIQINAHQSARDSKRTFSRNRDNLTVALGAATLAAGLTFIPRRNATHAEEPHDGPDHFRLEEIRKHNRDAENLWVYRGTRVYDITDFV